MKRKKHTSKSIENAIAFAESKGWSVISGGKSAHCWGRMLCPYGARNKDCRCGDFCIVSIWGTPKNHEQHARMLIKAVKKCQWREQND